MADPLSLNLLPGPAPAGGIANNLVLSPTTSNGATAPVSDFETMLSAQIGTAMPTTAALNPAILAGNLPPAATLIPPAAAPPALWREAPAIAQGSATAGKLAETGKNLPATLPPRFAANPGAAPATVPATSTSDEAATAPDETATDEAAADSTAVVASDPAANPDLMAPQMAPPQILQPQIVQPPIPQLMPTLPIATPAPPASAAQSSAPAGPRTSGLATRSQTPASAATSPATTPAIAAAEQPQSTPASATVPGVPPLPFALTALTIALPLSRAMRPGAGAASPAPAPADAPIASDEAAPTATPGSPALRDAAFAPTPLPKTATTAVSPSTAATAHSSTDVTREPSTSPGGQGDFGQGLPPLANPASMSPAGPVFVVSPEAATGPTTFSATAPALSISGVAGAPQDMTALVDRLVEARAAARAGSSPVAVAAAVRHAEFGQVSLRFEQDGDNLSVSMASADPGFARAAEAALAIQAAALPVASAATTTTSDNSNPQRQSFSAPANPGFAPQADAGGNAQQGQPQSRPQPQASAPTAFAAAPRSQAQADPTTRGAGNSPAQSGVFA